MASYDYPEDEFDARADDGREPIGTHRAPVPVWRSWMPLLLILILVPTLAWGAVTLLSHAKHDSAASSPSAAAPAAPAQDADQEDKDADAQAQDDSKQDAQAQPAPAEQKQPAAEATQQQADLSVGITIHNGSTINGLAGRTGERLTNAGYTGVHVEQGVYSLAAPETTTLYYADPSRAATAQAIGALLGITNVVESADGAQSNPIVIVLRADFSE